MSCFKPIKKLFYVYFTSLPLQLYNYSNKISNFGLLGVSIGLRDAKQKFWIANLGSLILIYNITNKDFLYYNLILSSFNIYLYISSIKQVMYLIKYIE